MPLSIESELGELPPDVLGLLDRHGFDRSRFFERVARAVARHTADNRIEGPVEPVRPEDLIDVQALDPEVRAQAVAAGEQALAAGQIALVVLAGGMATRMGGVVKALVEALPGKTFLDLRLAAQRDTLARYGAAPPLWLMTSQATDARLREALAGVADGYRVATFCQHLSLRVTPDGHVFRDRTGAPSVHAPGHGDLPDALAATGLLDRFIASGGKAVLVANIDNLGATLEPLIVGLHLTGGAAVSCELVDKVGSDRGGIPVRWNGRPVILEEFRLPEAFDASAVRVFNTNTFHFDARALRHLDMPWTYFVVEKSVDGARAVQFERLLGEVTSVLPTRYLKVSRAGASSRFTPCKDAEELAARRAELLAIARDRGMLT
jgi:UTP--glucose-1-phosphate uridylyltransferase